MNFWSRLTAFFRRKKLDADMAEEMREHLARRTEANRAAGMTPDEARYAAQRQFGGVEQLKEIAREQRGWPWLDALGRNLRFAFRQLRKARGVTATVILTLGLGIGAATAIFSVVHAVLLSPLQYQNADELVQIQSQAKDRGAAGLAPGTFGDVLAGTESFAAFAGQYYYYLNLTGTDAPAQLNSADVTADYFSVFGVAPWRGRTWSAEEAKSGAPVVVLSHALWQAQFNGSEALIGQPILLDNLAHTVIGVMPPSFRDPSETAQLWRPMRLGADDLTARTSRYWTVFARLKTPEALDRANAELAVLGQRLEQVYPQNYLGWTLKAVDLRRLVVGNYHTGLLVVLGAVGCVMAITCANVAGLAIVRAAARRKELAIRAALGSSRGQLVRQLLTESLLLAALGGAGGVLLAQGGLAALLSTLPAGWLPRAGEIALNLPVLGTTCVLTLATGLVAGLVPGLTAGRVDANDALKESARGSAGPSARRLRSGLVVGEIALALVLLAGTGLLARSFLGLMRTDPGIEPGRVLSLTVSLPAARYDSPPKFWDYFSRAEAEVAALPGVEAAGFTHTSPFRWGIPFHFAPVSAADPAVKDNLPQAFSDSVSVDFFRALGIRLRAGRTFTTADNRTTGAVVILSETAARRYFGEEDPIGRFITPDGGKNRFEVVGVVGDVRRSGLTTEAPLQVYRPLAQRTPPFATLMVRTSLPPATLTKSVQAALWRIDPEIPLSDVGTMETFVRRSVTQPRLYLVLFALFAGLALLLAAIGLYGLIAYGVEQRTREFGIRAALGARPREILAMVLREGAVLVLVGLAVGITGALAAAHLLQSMVFGTSLRDPLVFSVAPLLLAVIAVFACLLPARRATKVDPVIALRAE